MNTHTTDNARFKLSIRLFGLPFGGTSGISNWLSKQMNVLVSSSSDGTRKQQINIIAGFPKTDPSVPEHEDSKYSFIKVDATSMAQVREVTARLKGESEKVNFIVASTGFLTLKGRARQATVSIRDWRVISMHVCGLFTILHHW
ncbi:hypothetical protein FRB91_009598 [Serendipita sp. 411]|nr:hypothetical protein FRB91_009598 [Serendipita sp. 411]